MFKKKYRTQDTADLNNLCTGITQVNKKQTATNTSHYATVTAPGPPRLQLLRPLN